MFRKFLPLNLTLLAIALVLVAWNISQLSGNGDVSVDIEPDELSDDASVPRASVSLGRDLGSVDQYSAIWEKNLYHPERRLVEDEAPPTPTPVVTPVPKPQNLVLEGVGIFGDVDRWALLREPTIFSGRARLYREGDELLAYMVEIIQPDGVTLNGPGGPIWVPLREETDGESSDQSNQSKASARRGGRRTPPRPSRAKTVQTNKEESKPPVRLGTQYLRRPKK